MNININDIYHWTYGVYFNGSSKIRNDSIAALRSISKNRILFNLYNNNNSDGLIDAPSYKIGDTNGPDINGVYEGETSLEKVRQFIRVPFDMPTHIAKISVNSDIYPNLLFNGSDIVYENGDILTDKPFIRFDSLGGSIDIPISDCKYNVNTRQIEYVFDTILYRVVSITFYGSKPQKKTLIGPSLLPKTPLNNKWIGAAVGQSFIVDSPENNNRKNLVFEDTVTSVPGYSSLAIARPPLLSTLLNIPSLISTNYNSTELLPLSNTLGSYGALYSRLELQTKETIFTNVDQLKAVTINKQFYFMSVSDALSFANSPIKINPDYSPIDLYKSNSISSNGGMKSRIVLPFGRTWSKYQQPIPDQWVDELLRVIYDNSTDIKYLKFFNLDDFEFLDIFIADNVNLSSLNIEADDQSFVPSPTPTPSVTSTQTPTATVTNTPTSTAPFRILGKVVTLGTTNDSDGVTIVDQDADYAGVPLHFNRIFVGQNHALVSRDDKTIFPILDNSAYQLGVQIPASSIDKLNTVISSINSRWNRVAVGNKFSYLLDANNNLYRWGTNNLGQLASSINPIQFPSQVVLEHTRSFLDVSVTDDHTFIVDNKNDIYFTGSIYSSVKTNSFTKYPMSNGSWTRVFTTNQHTFAINKNQELYLIRDQENINSFFAPPVLIDKDLANFKDIACGRNHILVIKRDGSLWGFGDNSYYQLGNKFIDTKTSLTLIDDNRSWIKVAAGSRHSLAIDNMNNLYGWGDNSSKQFGISNLNTILSPTIIWSGNWLDISSYDILSLGIVDSANVSSNLITPTPQPSFTSTPTPTKTPTNTPTATPIPTNTLTPSQTVSSTVTNTPTKSATPTPTPTKPYNFSNVTIVP